MTTQTKEPTIAAQTKEMYLSGVAGITKAFKAFNFLMGGVCNVCEAADEMTKDLPEEARDDRMYESAVRKAGQAAKIAALKLPAPAA